MGNDWAVPVSSSSLFQTTLNMMPNYCAQTTYASDYLKEPLSESILLGTCIAHPQ